MAISISEVIKQNTVGQSDGAPVGVPSSWGWYGGLYKPEGNSAPPSNFTAVTGWAHIYQEAGAPAYSNPNASVEVANSRTYVHLRATGEWVLVQDQATTGITGAQFVTDFTGPSRSMRIGAGSDGSTAIGTPQAGYMDHFWPTARGTFADGAVDAVYVQMDMRVTDPNLHLIAQVGADWWRDTSVGFNPDHSNNPSAGTNNWKELSTQWSTMGFYSSTTEQFQADPPPLVGSAQTPPPVTGTPDTAAPAAPKIAAFTPDTGAVGDRITTASVLTLSGTAEAGSTVKLFDGTTEIGTAKANASGAWSVATSQLPGGTHNFTARATDAAGNTSSASSPLSLRVDAVTSPPVTSPPVTSPPVTSPPVTSPPPTGQNLLVNGSFEATSLAAGRWGGFSSVPGWTAISGGTIELWNNLNNVKATNGSNFGELDYLGARDGLYQTVKTTAGQSYDLSFDARSRADSGLTTNAIEVLWNDKVVATVPPGSSSWKTHHFSVTGTGGEDRLTFREAAGQSADGHGALYDNVSLVSKPSAVQQSAISQQPMNLVNQFAATSFADAGAGLSGGLGRTDLSATLAQTLAKAS
jgi:hypothetical protein